MKIEIEREEYLVKVENVAPGTVFEFDGELYLKTRKFYTDEKKYRNCIGISGFNQWCPETVADYTLVKTYDATLHLKEVKKEDES